MNRFQEFFLTVKDLNRKKALEVTPDDFRKWSQSEMDLNKKFLTAKNNVHVALCGKSFVEDFECELWLLT